MYFLLHSIDKHTHTHTLLQGTAQILALYTVERTLRPSHTYIKQVIPSFPPLMSHSSVSDPGAGMQNHSAITHILYPGFISSSVLGV